MDIIFYSLTLHVICGNELHNKKFGKTFAGLIFCKNVSYTERKEKMEPAIVVGLISLLGSAVGAFTGIVINSRMTNYRIEQLEQRVAEHNNYGRRIPVIEEQIKVINHRLEDLEKEV